MDELFRINEGQQRYELQVGAYVAYANTRKVQGVLDILYVEAPVPLRGTGAAGRLMERLMAQASKEGLKVRPICGYAVSWLRRHPDYSAHVAD